MVSSDSGTRNFNHRSNFIVHINFLLCQNLVSSFCDNVFHILKFFAVTSEWNHNFRNNCEAFLFFHFNSRCDNSLGLHSCNFWICDSKSKSAVTHHWVKFMQTFHSCFQRFKRKFHFFCKRSDFIVLMRQELVKRWVKETNCHRATFHCFEDTLKVFLLHWKKFFECFFSFSSCGRNNHFSHCWNSVCFKEHMFSSAKTYALCAKGESNRCVAWIISVCSYAKFSILISPFHDCGKFANNFSRFCGDCAIINLTS